MIYHIVSIKLLVDNPCYNTDSNFQLLLLLQHVTGLYAYNVLRLKILLPPMKVIDRTKAVTQHFLENSFKKLSIKKKIKKKNPKNKKICFLNVCCVMML